MKKTVANMCGCIFCLPSGFATVRYFEVGHDAIVECVWCAATWLFSEAQ